MLFTLSSTPRCKFLSPMDVFHSIGRVEYPNVCLNTGSDVIRTPTKTSYLSYLHKLWRQSFSKRLGTQLCFLWIGYKIKSTKKFFSYKIMVWRRWKCLQKMIHTWGKQVKWEKWRQSRVKVRHGKIETQEYDGASAREMCR